MALISLPHAMACALVLGLPLSTGIFAAIFSCMIAALFGSSRHLVNGPSNAIAILIQYGTAEILYHYYRHLVGIERELVAFQIMTQITLLAGLMHLLIASFKLGRLTQFVSYSVVLGYVVGAAAAIVISQLFVFMGIPDVEGGQSLWAKGLNFLSHLNEIHWTTLTIGLGSLTLLVGLKRWDRRFPAALITFVVVTAGLYLSKKFLGGEVHNVLLVGDAGELSKLIPQFAIPYFDLRIMSGLLPLAFAVALLSVLETIAVTKSIASYSGQRLFINQEILGLCLGNLTSALFGAMPVSGSTTRTLLNYEGGAQTRFAAVFGAILVGLVVYVFGGSVTHVPLATLSAILFVTAGSLIKKKQLLLCLKATKSDAFVFLVTFLSCIFFSIEVAFYIGVCLSITLYLKKAAIPQVLQYIVDESGHIKSLEFCAKEEITKIRFIKVKGELFFGAADLFQTTLKSIAEDDTDTRVIILQLKNARDIDATACLALQQLYDYVESSGRHLIISGITYTIWTVMSNSGLVQLIGKENLFVIDDRNPTRYFQRAIARAQRLVAESEEEDTVEAEVQEKVPGETLEAVPEGSTT